MTKLSCGIYNQDRCVICYEELGLYTDSLSCGHVFHESCIKSWLERCAQCPICRCNVETNSNNDELVNILINIREDNIETNIRHTDPVVIQLGMYDSILDGNCLHNVILSILGYIASNVFGQLDYYTITRQILEKILDYHSPSYELVNNYMHFFAAYDLLDKIEFLYPSLLY